MGQPLFQEPPTQPTTTTPPAGEPPTEPALTATPTPPPKDDSKGPAGGDRAILADLAKEREARKALEAKLVAMGQALGVEPTKGNKTDVEALQAQVAEIQRQQQAAELKAMRLEVAAEAGLTPAQAKRLTGTTRDELVADAAELKELFPPPAPGPTTGPGTPAPDPSQGARGGGADLHAAIRAAEEKGDFRESIRLKQGLLEQARAKQ